MDLKIKVCGIRNQENAIALEQLDIDFMGFIFYEKSKRNIIKSVSTNNTNLKRVGVFVNEKIEVVKEKVDTFQLDLLQLHGDESSEYCKILNELPIDLIKVFSIGDRFDFEKTKAYESYCNYFLFDTKGKERGGNGVTFDWSILNKYEGTTPFFLSGGIAPESINELKKLKHPKLFALDLNSKFEEKPGLKNIELIKTFIHDLQH